MREERGGTRGAGVSLAAQGLAVPYEAKLCVREVHGDISKAFFWGAEGANVGAISNLQSLNTARRPDAYGKLFSRQNYTSHLSKTTRRSSRIKKRSHDRTSDIAGREGECVPTALPR